MKTYGLNIGGDGGQMVGHEPKDIMNLKRKLQEPHNDN